jgi:hypothetical protein
LYIEDEQPRRFSPQNINTKIERKRRSSKGALKQLFHITRHSKKYKTSQDAFSETDEKPNGCKIG